MMIILSAEEAALIKQKPDGRRRSDPSQRELLLAGNVLFLPNRKHHPFSKTFQGTGKRITARRGTHKDMDGLFVWLIDA